MTAALAGGSRELFGWGQDRHLLADIFDAVNSNTRATGNWGKGKAPKIPLWPRPKAKKAGDETPKPQKKKVSVADLFAQFNRR